MDKLFLGKSSLESSILTYGCMRIAADRERGKKAIQAALDEGYNHFDHADIYGGGACEELFGEVLKDTPGLRDQILLTSKCSIKIATASTPGHYDFSYDHIVSSVEGMLKRLQTDHLDLLLLHRPDYLGHPAEVAHAFETLQETGKVRWFGVSNFLPSQVAALRQHCPVPLIANQVEINIHNIDPLQNGVLDQCLELGITPQVWCPLGGVAYPAWGNTFTEETETRIADEFKRQQEIYDQEPWIIMLAWLLKLPARVNPIIGSTSPDRIKAAKLTLEIDYTREDWYRLLEARNGTPVP